jgi:hypothetical protein
MDAALRNVQNSLVSYLRGEGFNVTVLKPDSTTNSASCQPVNGDCVVSMGARRQRPRVEEALGGRWEPPQPRLGGIGDKGVSYGRAGRMVSVVAVRNM